MKAELRKKYLSRISFISLLVLVGVVELLFLYNIIKWGDYPDFGFSFRTATGVDVVGVLTDHGQKAGLQIGDRILTVNNKRFSTYMELNAAKRWGPDEKNTYLIERGGNQFEITIPNIRYSLKRAFNVSGLPFLFGLCYIIVGALVFLMKPHERTSWVFMLFTTVFGLFVSYLFKVSALNPLWLENVIIFAYCFLPATLFHLALTFPEERGILKKHPYAQIISYIVSAFLFLWIRLVTPTMTDAPKAAVTIAVMYLAVGVLWFLGSCLQLRLTSSSEIVKLRSRMILLGFAVASSVPLADFVSNTLFHVYFLPGFNFYLPFFIIVALSIGYSIVKHDLFDIDAFIKRAYGYVLTTGAIAGLYGLFVLLSNIVFGGFEFARSPAFPLVFILGVVFLFNPIRNRVQKFIDRIFYRLEYDYQATVQRISETMRTLLSLNEVGKKIMDTALGAMFIDSGGVMLLNPEKQVYEYLVTAGEREKAGPGQAEKEMAVAGALQDKEELQPVPLTSELTLTVNNALIQKMTERKREVTIYDIQEDPFFADEKEPCRKAFDLMEATLVVPLVYKDDLTGLISLGQKKSGKFYRREDINLLKTLANQGAVAIENARLFQENLEKQRMEEELAIGRELQMSMLPSECPEVEGFEIAAFSMPAMEVGGDFYDFIEMGDTRAGMVVGDVTGKSVSGALVMSASRSVFRMLSEEDLTVGEIMTRANRRIKQDIKSGMFVALLYAVLDSTERMLRLCSAGQTQPVLLSGETGEAKLVETEGDTFPLGIIDEVDYQETRLQLASGDRVILYTDGIVEAMNEEKEMFGFDRLLEVVQGAGSMAAEALLKEIMGRVNAFAGGAAQHDDLTVIVISVGG